MALTVTHIPVDLGRAQPPRVRFRFRLLREGEVTANKKNLVLYRDFNSTALTCLGFSTDDGEYTQYETVLLSALTDQGDWLVVGYDDAAPKKIRAAYLSVGADGTYTFNITSGDGGAVGDPGTLDARVRVDKAAVSREVLVVEKPSSGQWRIAGYGPVPGGDGAIDVRVSDGDCYAIGLDDWGVVFAANLPVSIGDVIRPTVFLGWTYRITQAGVLPAVEPDWWDESVIGPQLIGTARAEVSRYYQPIAHGPLPIEGV